MLRSFFYTFLSLISLSIFAQDSTSITHHKEKKFLQKIRFGYYAEFHQFFDNREYKYGYQPSQTMLGGRLNAMVGAKVDSTQGFFAGINYLYEYGDRIDGNMPTVNLFYYFQIPKFTAIFGSFPRRGLLNYPLAILTDSLDNYRPNIQGGFFEVRGKWGFQNLWVDWTGRQRNNVRETFLAGFSGRVNILPQSLFFFDHYFTMFHNAGTALLNEAVEDNGGYSLLLGTDLTTYTPLSLFNVRVGMLGSYDRQRAFTDKISFQAGGFAQLNLHYKWVGISILLFGTKIGYPIWRQIVWQWQLCAYQCGRYAFCNFS